MNVLRVFPRRTRATPVDSMAWVGYPTLFTPKADEVHISVAFTWDLLLAEKLARAWEPYGRVRIGGPATGMRGEAFVPRMYLRPGYVITSRGCPNHCWFCSVWRREGRVRELAIRDGWIVNDDNLLACSEGHIRAVFAMLAGQPKRAEFVGGLEAARLLPWHVEELTKLRPAAVWFAYDEPEDLAPLIRAGEMFRRAAPWWGRHRLRCYVLVGHPKDTFADAETRLRESIAAGFWPMAMLWRDPRTGTRPGGWIAFQKAWARPAAIYVRLREEKCAGESPVPFAAVRGPQCP